MMQPEVLKQFSDLIQQSIRQHIFPGCATVVMDSHELFLRAYGYHTYQSDSPTVTVQTLYDIASITKSIPTTCVALHLIEVGKIRLNDRVDQYLLQSKGKPIGRLIIKDLITFLPHFPINLASLKDLQSADILDRVLSLDWEESTSIQPNNTTSIILTMVLQAVTDSSLDQLADQVFFNPLGMNSTTFFPERLPLSNIAPTEIDAWRGRLIHGEVHDESAWKLRSKLVVGSAGLFSTVDNLSSFVKMLLLKGQYQDRIYFQPSTVDQMSCNQLSEHGLSAGLGWELHQQWMGDYCSVNTYGKTGFTGCFIAIDPKQSKAIVFLSNTIYPHRPSDRTKFNLFRRQLCDIIFTS